jgi:hypothetical protein
VSAPLVSAAEMAGLRDVAEQGMQTPVIIQTRATVQSDDGQTSTWTTTGTVMGWLYSTPTPQITLVSGEMATVNTYRLFLPVGTAIAAGDHAIIGGQTFIVSDTTAESTWQPLLRCSLRYAE